MNKEKFLPVGTTVKLNGERGICVIMGFLVQKQESNDKKVYDYLGCTYPYGFYDPTISLMFNHSDISEVLHEGYVNDDWNSFDEKLKEVVKEQNL